MDKSECDARNLQNKVLPVMALQKLTSECTLKTAYTKHLKYVKRKIETKRGAVEIQRRNKQTKQHQPSDVNAIRSEWPSKKERRVDALALRADERRDKLRKASGRSKYPMSRRYLNGETHMRRPHVSIRQSITYGGEPGELKHLSTPRRRKKTRFPK